MRYVAMILLLHPGVPILFPFLQLPLSTNLIRRQSFAHRPQGCRKFRVTIENICRLCGVIEQVPDDLAVHCRSSGDGYAGQMCIFRRHCRIRDQPVGFWVLHESIDKKLACTLQKRISTNQERRIWVKSVMLPQVITQPRSAGLPHAKESIVDRCGCTPDIGVMVCNPAAGTIHFLSGPRQ